MNSEMLYVIMRADILLIVWLEGLVFLACLLAKHRCFGADWKILSAILANFSELLFKIYPKRHDGIEPWPYIV